MFFFSFDQYFGWDKLIQASPDSTIDGLVAGDLVLIGWKYFLLLGDSINSRCDYEITISDYHLAEKQLLRHDTTIPQIHHLVQEFFCTYHSVIRLFVSSDIIRLLDRKKIAKKSLSDRHHELITYDAGTQSLVTTPVWNTINWQQCFVFPTLWSITCALAFDSQQSQYIQTLIEKKQAIILTSTMTEKQRNEAFWNIKQGHISLVLCTHSSLFQDRCNLASIEIISPHLWFYKNRQEPRYETGNVILYMNEKIVEIREN